MPITFDSSGKASYVPVRVMYFSERPEQFLSDKAYRDRLAEGRRRVLEAIRFAEKPLAGLGMNHEIEHTGDKRRVEHLTDLVDQYDRRRYDRLNRQRARERQFGLSPYEHRMRSPQDIGRRRSALFSGADIPAKYFAGMRIGRQEISRFVNLMRWYIINDAIWQMYAENELVYMNDGWYVPVTVMDVHRRHRDGKSNRVKRDDRSSHGAIGTRRDADRAVRHEEGRLARQVS